MVDQELKKGKIEKGDINGTHHHPIHQHLNQDPGPELDPDLAHEATEKVWKRRWNLSHIL